VLTAYSVSKIKFQSNENEPIIIDELPIDNSQGSIDLEEDAFGCIWIACNGNKIIRYNPKTKSIQNITQSNSFLKTFSKQYWSLTIDQNQKIWVGTKDKGMIRIDYDFQTNEILNVKSIQNDPDNAWGLSSNLIMSTYISKLNNLWIGTIGSGINIFDPEIKKIKHYKIKSQGTQISNTNFIRAVIADNKNHILAGAQYNGLYLFDRETKQSIKLGFDTESVFHICKYRDNTYLVCSGKGISLVELNGSTLRILNRCEGFKSPAFYVLHSRNNVYWCATIYGLIRIKINNNKIEFDGQYNKFTYPALSMDNCRVLCFDKIKTRL
jgi:ligand-binding sensor domain-containing protein